MINNNWKVRTYNWFIRTECCQCTPAVSFSTSSRFTHIPSIHQEAFADSILYYQQDGVVQLLLTVDVQQTCCFYQYNSLSTDATVNTLSKFVSESSVDTPDEMPDEMPMLRMPAVGHARSIISV